MISTDLPFSPHAVDNTVDGSEIRPTHQLRLVVYPIFLIKFYTSQRGFLAGFLEESSLGPARGIGLSIPRPGPCQLTLVK